MISTIYSIHFMVIIINKLWYRKVLSILISKDWPNYMGITCCHSRSFPIPYFVVVSSVAWLVDCGKSKDPCIIQPSNSMDIMTSLKG